jgi:hypothetical protein
MMLVNYLQIQETYTGTVLDSPGLPAITGIQNEPCISGCPAI